MRSTQFYSDKQLEDLQEKLQSVEGRTDSLILEYMAHSFASRYLSPKLRVLIDFLTENLVPKADQPRRTSAFSVATPSNSTNIVPHPLSGFREHNGGFA